VLSDLSAGLVGPPEHPAAPQLEIEVARRAVLTRRGKLRIRVTCVGPSGGWARFVVGRGGQREVALAPGCRRAVEIPLKRRFARRLRRGKIRAVRLTAIGPDGEAVTSRLRVRT
jgi:hypothetical protein